jgi:hypothetical protein
MILEYELTPPAVFIDGDTWQKDGHYLNQMRGSVVVQTWNLRAMTSQRLTLPATTGETISKFYLEQGMPGQTLSITQVRRHEDDSVTFSFSNGDNMTLPSWEIAAESADIVDSDPMFLQRILIGKSYRNDPSGANMVNQVGAQVSANLSANEPIVYTPADA